MINIYLLRLARSVDIGTPFFVTMRGADKGIWVVECLG